MELGWPHTKRIEHLQTISRDVNSTKSTYPVKLQGQMRNIPIVVVPIELPKYRLENGRTRAAQIEYAATHSIDPDLFKADIESSEAQKIQHEILKELITGADLLSYFKNHRQEEPLILDHHGFVVNGNRRLCTFRTLFEENLDKYEHFKNVQVIILPAVDRKAIDELEAQLQVHKDIKAKYSWENEAIMYRDRLDYHGVSVDELCRMYEINEKQLNRLFEMLSYAEAYLKHIEKPSQYHLVSKHEYAFDKIVSQVKNIRENDKRQAFVYLAFSMLGDATGARLYQAIPDAAKNLDSVIKRMGDELPTSTDNLAGKQEEKAELDLLGANIAPSVNVEPRLLAALSDPSLQVDIRDIVREVIESNKEFEKEKKNVQMSVTLLQKASASINDAKRAMNQDTPTDSLLVQLDSIEKAIAEFKGLLNASET